MSEPIQAKFHPLMNALAHHLDIMFNGEVKPPARPKNGFVLLTFEFGKTEGGRVNYISNADRADMLTAMKEFIARAEGRVANTPDTRQ